MTFRRLSHGRDKLSETKPRRRRRAGPQLIHNSLARFPLTTTTPGHVKNVFFQKNIYWGGGGGGLGPLVWEDIETKQTVVNSKLKFIRHPAHVTVILRATAVN
jgi:hypothetical protein